MQRLVYLLSFLFCFELAYSIESVKLSDVITSKGVGDINLLKDISVTDIEAYRLDCGGNLIFAVDVNEAASGTEKASSQGVTVKSVKLVIGYTDNTTDEFTSFHTRTQAIVAPEGSTDRALYYTLLGDTGSSRITTNSVRGEFDSVLEVSVQKNLTNVESATLLVELLQTNVDLGDPEAFYDFSNGFEDLAILNSTDAGYLIEEEFGQEEAPVVIEVFPDPIADPSYEIVNTIYHPSSTTYCTVAFEDLYPSRGDYDFNDLIVNYQVSMGLNADGDVVKISGVSYLIARGAGLDSDFHLRIKSEGFTYEGNVEIIRTNPISLNTTTRAEILSELDLVLFESTKNIFAANEGFAFTNTNSESGFKKGPKSEFTIYLSQPVPLSSFADLPLDPYIYLPSSGLEVHLPNNDPTPNSNNVLQGFTSFIDDYGYPFAMLIPEEWSYPVEFVNLTEAYPNFINYVLSGQTQDIDWYQFPQSTKTKQHNKDQWTW